MGNAVGYEGTFGRFDAVGGRWIATWNWGAFVFGIFWYLYKGLWAKALIYFGVIFLLATITGGIAAIPIWIAWGLIGNYDMYLLYRKRTQLWHNAGIAPNAVPGVTSPVGNPTGAASRLDALERARQQGVITEAEFAAKRAHLEFDAEREQKLSALEGMRRNGLMSDVEFEQRRREIESQMPPSAGATNLNKPI